MKYPPLILCYNFHNRVAENDNVDLLAKITDCLPVYIAKGVAMATFYYARCLQYGLGMQQDQAAAKKYYSRVSLGGPPNLFLEHKILSETLHLNP